MRFHTISVCAFFLLIPVIASAVGDDSVFLIGNSAQQMGRAGSGVASPRNSAQAFLNPAGLVDLDRRLDLNLYTVTGVITVEPYGLAGNTITGQMKDDIFEVFPTGGFTWPLSKGVFSAGIYVPMSARVNLPESRNIFARVDRQTSDLDRHLEYLRAQLVLAWAYRFQNGWAFGIAAHASLSRIRTDSYTPHVQPTEGDMEPEYLPGAGFGIGVYRRWKRFAIGASYLSRHWSRTPRKYPDLLIFPLDMPPVIQAGIAWKLHEKLELTLDYRYTKWRDVEFYGNDPINFGLGWRNQHGVKAGLEWRALPRWTFMAGFSHANAAVHDDHVFVNILTPACLKDYATAGVTFRLRERFDVHLTFLHAFENSMTDTGRGDVFSFFGKGSSISLKGNALALGLTWHF